MSAAVATHAFAAPEARFRISAGFIDNAYLGKVCDEAGGFKIDIAAFAKRIACGHFSVATYFYDCLPYLARRGPIAVEDQARFDRKSRYLSEISRLPGLRIRKGRLAKRFDANGRVKFVQKQVDVFQAIDMSVLSVKGTITDAAVVAGDADILGGVLEANAAGVRVHLFHGHNPDEELLQVCDRTTLMDEAFSHRFNAHSQCKRSEHSL